jgi:membrane protease YdiL (CAAX protease family)
MNRNLAGADPTLVWLWQFPISRPVLFLSRLVEYVFDTPMALAAAFLAAIPLWMLGCSVGTVLALPAIFAISAVTTSAAIRLTIEICLLQKCSRKVRGAFVAGATGLGGCGMLAAMFLGNAQVTTEAFLSVAQRLPAWAFVNPWSHGLGSPALLHGVAGWWLAAPVMALVLAGGAAWLATALTAGGLASSQDSVRGSRALRRGGWATTGLFRGLVWKELLQLRRQPELLGQVILVVPFVLIMLYLAAPEKSLSLATRDAATICTSIFVSGAYLLLVAGAQLLTSELKTLWFLQSQPCSLADSIRVKARTWGVITVLLTLPLLAWALAARPEDRMDIARRVPFVIAYLLLAAELSFGMLSLGATVLNEQTVRFRPGSRWLPGLVVAACASSIHGGELWGQTVLLIVLATLGAAVRERQQFELNWLSEPVESPPMRFYAMHALVIVLGFTFLQGAVAGALAAAKFSRGETWTISYCASALVIGAATWLTRRQMPLDTLNARPRGPVGRPLALGMLVSCLAGFSLVVCLRLAGQTALAAGIDLFSDPGACRQTWPLAAMMVLVAPPVEEWVFRGLLYRGLRRSRGILASVVLTSLLFTAIHPLVSSFGVATLAVVTALVVEKTGRVWPAMLIHVCYNVVIIASWNLPLGR